MSVRVEQGDCREVIPKLGVMVDAVVTDPPYHLMALHTRAANATASGPFSAAHRRLATGFMGQQWDGGDIAFRAETWATIASVMRPGGFLVAFGGTRTYHRLVSAIEDAGFVIQDQIAWLFGSGFPKRCDMLKPAFEPICLAYKPGGKRLLQVDECRIALDADVNAEQLQRQQSNRITWEGGSNSRFASDHVQPLYNKSGRWPANVCHDGSEEVIEAFPDDLTSGKPVGTRKAAHHFGTPETGTPLTGFGDSGSAARFFYCAKADKQDRWGSRHPTVKPVELMKWLVPLVTPAGGLVLDPFAGSGTTGVAALATGRDCILIEREAQYIADIKERLAFYEGGGTHSVQAKNRSRQTDAGPLFA